MEQAISIDHNRLEGAKHKLFAIDTTFVLFFLALDFGQSFEYVGMGSLLSAVTLLSLLAMPYLLPFDGEKPLFASWVLGRMVIAVFGVILGTMLRQAIGVVFPEIFRFLPMTFLIVTAIVSSYIQFCGIIKFRLAK